jgi:hypothetical protein
MAVESKPLFHPEVLRQQVRSFNLPEQTGAWQPKIQHWADLIASGRADELTETTLLSDFLTDFFYGLLGYTGPAGSNAVDSCNLPDASGAPPSPPREERAGERRSLARGHFDPAPPVPGLAGAYTLSQERQVEVDGEFADAVLGRFQKNKQQFIAALEGKGARDPLDRPFAGRRMSAVDQAYRYAINLPRERCLRSRNLSSFPCSRVGPNHCHSRASLALGLLHAVRGSRKTSHSLTNHSQTVPSRHECGPHG